MSSLPLLKGSSKPSLLWHSAILFYLPAHMSLYLIVLSAVSLKWVRSDLSPLFTRCCIYSWQPRPFSLFLCQTRQASSSASFQTVNSPSPGHHHDLSLSLLQYELIVLFKQAMRAVQHAGMLNTFLLEIFSLRHTWTAFAFLTFWWPMHSFYLSVARVSLFLCYFLLMNSQLTAEIHLISP